MKFTCDRAALTEAVNIVQKAVATRSTLAVLEGILIKAKDGKITLTGNDLEIGIEAIVGAEIGSEGKVVVNSNLFGSAVRKLSGELLVVDVSASNTVSIKSGNSDIRLNGINGEEFPEIPKFDTEFDLALRKRELKELVRHTIFSVGTSESKLILTGCLLEASGSGVNMVAVDGFRLAFKKMVHDGDAVSGSAGRDVSIVIPSKTLKELTGILGDSDDSVVIRCSQKNVRFEFDNVIFTSRLLEGDYIDYKKIIPTEFKTRLSVELRSLIEAVDRASIIITSEVTKSPLTLKIANGDIKITCETSAGKVEELVSADVTGDDIEIGFNNRYLLEALRAATGERVNMAFIGSVNPCLITPAEGDSFKFIVLPVRLRNDA